MKIVQGDVIIKSIDEVPESARRVDGGVLASGEATGHAHVATGKDVEVFELNGILYLHVPDDGECAVVHEEHDAVTVPPGSYEVTRQREYDHFAEEARQVRD